MTFALQAPSYYPCITDRAVVGNSNGNVCHSHQNWLCVDHGGSTERSVSYMTDSCLDVVRHHLFGKINHQLGDKTLFLTKLNLTIGIKSSNTRCFLPAMLLCKQSLCNKCSYRFTCTYYTAQATVFSYLFHFCFPWKDALINVLKSG